MIISFFELLKYNSFFCKNLMPIHETYQDNLSFLNQNLYTRKNLEVWSTAKTSENLNLEQTFKIIPSDFIKKEWKGLLLLTLNMLFATGKWFSG